MGQAKQRGTFEQRRLEAQHTEALRMEQRRVQIEATKEAERQRRAALPPPSVRQGPPKPPTHSAFGRRRGMGRTVLMAATFAALGMGLAQPSPTKGNGDTDKGARDE